MRFFFDNNFSIRLVRMLQALDVDAVALRDCFPQSIDDEDYLPRLANTGFILVTCDRHIRTRKAQARALRQAGVAALFFNPFFQKKDRWGQAYWLVKNWPRIEEHARRLSSGGYAQVPERGPIRLINL